MKTTFFILFSAFLINSSPYTASTESQDFQGKAYYFSQSKMELGNWGARMSEAQKKQMKERLKNRLEKTFVLSFNKEASFFKEEEKVDAYSGATDSWGSNFSRGAQYKNIQDNSLVQEQEFYRAPRAPPHPSSPHALPPCASSHRCCRRFCVGTPCTLANPQAAQPARR